MKWCPGCLLTSRLLRTSRNFRLLFLGQLVSLLGSNLTIVAVAYQVYQETHSSLWVGVVSFIPTSTSHHRFSLGRRTWGPFRPANAAHHRVVRTGSLKLCARRERFPSSRQLRGVGYCARAGGRVSRDSRGPFERPAIPTLVRPEELVAAYSLNQIILTSAPLPVRARRACCWRRSASRGATSSTA